MNESIHPTNALETKTESIVLEQLGLAVPFYANAPY